MRLAGMRPRKHQERQPRGLNRIPAAWTNHSKSCGWAGTGECLFCGDEGEQSMYKALDQSIRDSEKLAEVSDFAYRVWNQGLATSDMMGRISASPKKFWAHAMPHVQFDQQKIEAAMKELEDKRLVHFYVVDEKKYMVYHNHDEHNKGIKNLKYQKVECPPPPSSLCYCIGYAKSEELEETAGDVSAVASAVPTADATVYVHSPSPSPSLVHVTVPEGVQGEPNPTSPEAQLIGVAEQQRVIAKPDTLRRYVTGWISDKGFEFVQKSLMDPWSRGKDVLSIHDRFFRVNGNGKNHGPPLSKLKKPDPGCTNCGGSGRRDNPATRGKMDCGCLR